jgi:hypothetical protein
VILARKGWSGTLTPAVALLNGRGLDLGRGGR